MSVLVSVETFYIDNQSDSAADRYVFAYTITIDNQTAERVQLLRRYWKITDANAKVTEVNGDGVIGEQPYLAPGERFTYTSGAVLETPVGTMQGHYEMVAAEHREFIVPIPLFRLAVPGVLN